ncbi:hypothetical protein N8508_00395 [bacterium]|nr:hypothetical protein [bacterium]
MSLLIELKNMNFPYSPTIVRDLIIQNKEKYGYIKPITKKIIFFMMRRIVLRGVVTYSNINKNRGNEVVRNDDDMVNEIYFVLDKCVDKFDVDRNKDFYLYFSSSVSRRVSRMSNYKKVVDGEITFSKYESQFNGDEQLTVDELFADKTIKNDGDSDFFEFIENVDFDNIERKVLESIKQGRGVKDIQNENNINKKQLDGVMIRIRNKIVYEEAKDEIMAKLIHKI